VAPHRVAQYDPATMVVGLASGSPAVLVAWLQIATGVHWLLLVFVLALMFLDWSAGALRADVVAHERYDSARDFEGYRKRAAYLLMVAGAFVVDGMLLAASDATGLWPGVFASGPLTLGALVWAARAALQGFIRNLAAVLGRGKVFTGLVIAAEAMGELSARVTRGVAEAPQRSALGPLRRLSRPGSRALRIPKSSAHRPPPGP
jgi:hypothetical protein